MIHIELKQTLPNAFASLNGIVSDIWHHHITLSKGERVLVEAASGTGKSSLLSYLYGYREDYQGIICFDGGNIRQLARTQWEDLRKTSLSIMWQDLRLFPELTAWENVMLKNSITRYKTPKEVETWFEALGIADKRNALTGKMSFGQQQRVALIRALCQPFDFLLMDEPVSHLDEANAKALASIVSEETNRQGAGLIVTSIGKHLVMDYDKTMKL